MKSSWMHDFGRALITWHIFETLHCLCRQKIECWASVSAILCRPNDHLSRSSSLSSLPRNGLFFSMTDHGCVQHGFIATTAWLPILRVAYCSARGPVEVLKLMKCQYFCSRVKSKVESRFQKKNKNAWALLEVEICTRGKHPIAFPFFDFGSV